MNILLVVVGIILIGTTGYFIFIDKPDITIPGGDVPLVVKGDRIDCLVVLQSNADNVIIQSATCSVVAECEESQFGQWKPIGGGSIYEEYGQYYIDPDPLTYYKGKVGISVTSDDNVLSWHKKSYNLKGSGVEKSYKLSACTLDETQHDVLVITNPDNPEMPISRTNVKAR